ncbi:MAG: dTMP kinase [Sphingomonadaceae bacterium]
MVKSGCFIVFEGGEGSGKTTQAQLLAGALAERGLEVVSTREPGGTPGAEAIRTMLLDPPGQGWGARAEALLFAAARSDHVERLIRPALQRGAWVVCDRFVDSSRAYQGGAGRLGDETIVTLHDIGSQGLRPDLTILVDVDPKTVSHRLAERDGGASDAIGGRDADYHARVADAFRALAAADPEGFRVIDGSGLPEQVHNRVLATLGSLLEGAP